MDKYIAKISEELELKPHQVSATVELLEGEATVPFIARYRKEATGELDEVEITNVRDRLAQLKELDKRRESICKSLEERELLTDELKIQLEAAETMAVLEDIYLPYRPKRRTRATVAKEKGLEPLAKVLMEQDPAVEPLTEAAAYLDAEKGVETVEEALAGARDIIAEWVSEDQTARARLRILFEQEGLVKSRVITGKEEEGSKFRDYFEWDEPVRTSPSHRILAMRRGEAEGALLLKMRPPEEAALAILESLFVREAGPAAEQVREAVQDSFNRLLSLSMETEVRLAVKQRADAEAIRVFADNLRELLLAPPLGQKRVMAVDPGFRTGCKIACLDSQGKLLHTDTIYLVGSEQAKAAAAEKVVRLCEEYAPEAIAVGNGTASRETEAFIKALIPGGRIPVVVVNESGASIYSASEVARAEFPDLDLTFRGAVSIGRRLTDPLAELVKIDAKSIGVGQYQHDVNQTELKKSLDDVVVSCVNHVGVEVNTSSEQLLTYVSGLGPQLARNILAYRNENGPFGSREELRKVHRLGPKAFELAAGFLRIRDAENPLDASAVHPESYSIVTTMAADLGCTVGDLMAEESLRKKLDLSAYVSDKVGLPTLSDIMAELAKPGRDPRSEFKAFSFTDGVETIQDLSAGMRLPGVVTNVTAFGAFVDIGVHQDGLVHISQLADRFIKEPQEVVKVHQQVMVTVLEVDLRRNRISLSMKENPEQSGPRPEQSGPRPEQSGPRPDKPGPPAGRKNKADQKHKQKPGPQPFNNPFARAFKK